MRFAVVGQSHGPLARDRNRVLSYAAYLIPMGAPMKVQILKHEDHYLGIKGLRVDGVVETYDAVTCAVRVLPGKRPSCQECDDDALPRVHDYIQLQVADTPSRGRKTVLVLEVPRYRHRCGATIDARRPAFLHPELPATRRLVRYAEGQTFRRPVLDIAREIGLPEPEIRKLAISLARRLRNYHRFPTPEVLAIDDLRIKRRLYTVVTDGTSGRAIALVEGGAYEDIEQELRRRGLEYDRVRCIVSDMGGSNNKVVRRLFKGKPAVHVADKWHILRYAHKALSRVISQEIDKLEKPPKGTLPNDAKTMKAEAATIRAARRQLMGARLKDPDERQGALKLDKVGPVLRNQRISCAFWSKIRLHQAYAADTREDAIRLGILFAHRARNPAIVEEMKPTLAHIRRYRHPILRYWQARRADGSLLRPSTGPAERRNGSIRKIWRSAHGFKTHALFELRALYEPWQLDVDIIICAEPRCMAVDGPILPHGRKFAAVQDAADIRCSAHASGPSSDS